MKDLLKRIAQNPALEARWLNTLSLMEYIGARKIGKSVGENHPSAEILRHWAHETRHASAFRKLADEVAGGECREYLCHDEAISYFQMLDSTVTEWLNDLTKRDDTYQNYILVTCLIERRAMKLYPLYKKATKIEAIADELEAIIEEETSHRHVIDSTCKKMLEGWDSKGIDHCEQIEEKLFDVLQASLTREVSIAEEALSPQVQEARN